MQKNRAKIRLFCNFFSFLLRNYYFVSEKIWWFRFFFVPLPPITKNMQLW